MEYISSVSSPISTHRLGIEKDGDNLMKIVNMQLFLEWQCTQLRTLDLI